MRQFYFLFFGLFFFQYSFGQIGYQYNEILNNSEIGLDSDNRSVYAVDLDGDGFEDVVVGSSNGMVGWIRNNGQGGFDLLKVISTDLYSIRTVYSVDIDGDGDMDVISTSTSNDKIDWYENLDGLGNFGTQNVISVNADGVNAVYAVDIDGDGDMDVLSSSLNDKKIAWYENTNGLGLFGSEQIINDNFNLARSVHAADIDGDGDMDVLSVSNTKVLWYENIDGLGTFEIGQDIPSSGLVGAKNVDTSDIDGDGDMDVLVAAVSGNIMRWYENDGNGSGWNAHNIIIDNFYSIYTIHSARTADIDNDGDLDIILTYDFNVILLKNLNGQGNFGTANSLNNYLGSAEVYSTTISDIENDGDLDILATATGGIDLYKYNSNQNSFGPGSLINICSCQFTSVDSFDLDNDGDNDIIAGAINSELEEVVIFFENRNNEYRTVKKIANYGLGLINYIKGVDFDGDGDIDLFATSDEDDIFWFENLDGQGTYSNVKFIGTAPALQATFLSDLNGDGDLDVLSASSYDDTIKWYENNGQGTFGTEQIISSTVDAAHSVYAADIDGDGDIDVVSASYNDDTVAWYENIDGQGNFGITQVISSNLNGVDSLNSCDLDGDNDMDVISYSWLNNKLVWYENLDGQGTFDNEKIVVENLYYVNSIDSADLDNDGNIDVIVKTSNQTRFYQNLGSAEDFQPHQTVDGYAFDYNNDGRVDFFGTNSSGNNLFWYKNVGELVNQISGNVRFDINNNGCDFNDISVPDLQIVADNGNDSFSIFTDENGSYQLDVNQGNFIITFASLTNYYSSSPTSYPFNLNGTNMSVVADFCLEAIQTLNDLNISIYPSINDPRPGFDTTYQIVYKNIGTTQLSGSVSFEFDDSKLNFLSASETATSQTGNTLNFDFTDLNPFETRTIDLDFNVFAPPTTNIGDELVATAIINPVSGDETEEDNTFTLNQTVIGSYDPNDIQVLEGDQILIEDADKYLHYIIRFQNTGTASAINVRVENILDEKLDWTSMQLESLSHNGRVEILNGSEVSFIFNNINLPDSTSDEPNSHGFIAYKIKPLDNVEVGDIFFNTADIFFDFNPPITTNTVATEIVEPLSLDESNVSELQYYPNPVKERLYLKSNAIIEAVEIIDILGNTVYSNTFSSMEIELDLSELATSMYFVTVKNNTNQKVIKILKE